MKSSREARSASTLDDRGGRPAGRSIRRSRTRSGGRWSKLRITASPRSLFVDPQPRVRGQRFQVEHRHQLPRSSALHALTGGLLDCLGRDPERRCRRWSPRWSPVSSAPALPSGHQVPPQVQHRQHAPPVVEAPRAGTPACPARASARRAAVASITCSAATAKRSPHNVKRTNSRLPRSRVLVDRRAGRAHVPAPRAAPGPRPASDAR